ncbi:MAG TPA: tetratricopeptide repeat protein, partial [Acidobacteriota bacterium]|nr:tetratricopeptide repeat protein [Acidobacteriota bacterium]
MGAKMSAAGRDRRQGAVFVDGCAHRKIKKMTDTAKLTGNQRMDKQTLSTLIQQGRYADALALGKQLCAATPDDVSLWMMLANAQVSSGRLDEVVHSCDRVIALQPENATAHSNRGIALYSMRRLRQAEQSFRAALALDPSLISAGNNLGIV